MDIDTLEALEEALEDMLPPGFYIEPDKNGQLIIYSNLKEDEDGFLNPIADEEEDEEIDGDLERLPDDDDD